jgi:hypothetical protein
VVAVGKAAWRASAGGNQPETGVFFLRFTLDALQAKDDETPVRGNLGVGNELELVKVFGRNWTLFFSHFSSRDSGNPGNNDSRVRPSLPLSENKNGRSSEPAISIFTYVGERSSIFLSAAGHWPETSTFISWTKACPSPESYTTLEEVPFLAIARPPLAFAYIMPQRRRVVYREVSYLHL